MWNEKDAYRGSEYVEEPPPKYNNPNPNFAITDESMYNVDSIPMAFAEPIIASEVSPPLPSNSSSNNDNDNNTPSWANEPSQQHYQQQQQTRNQQGFATLTVAYLSPQTCPFFCCFPFGERQPTSSVKFTLLVTSPLYRENSLAKNGELKIRQGQTHSINVPCISGAALNLKVRRKGFFKNIMSAFGFGDGDAASIDLVVKPGDAVYVEIGVDKSRDDHYFRVVSYERAKKVWRF